MAGASNTSRPSAVRRWLRRFFWIGLAFVLMSWLLGRTVGPTVEDGSYLVVPISGNYVEASEAPLVERLLGSPGRPMLSLLGQLSMAERDDRLAGVVFRIGPVGMGWGKAQELRLAIERLRAAGRQTVAVLEFETLSAMKEYYIASAADEVYVTPGSLVPVTGLAAEYLYLGGSFERVGIDWEVVRAGRYKSAVETRAERGMSDDAREMTNAMLDSIEAQLLRDIASSRGLEVAEVRTAIDAAPLRSQELVAHKLIEGERGFAELLEGFEPRISAREYANVDPAEVGFDPVARYALIYGSGTVLTGEAPANGGPTFASDVAVEALEAAAEDPEIDGVILRMDTPGGAALAAEIIWQAVERVKASGKPVVASYSDYAASAGYYVSSGADRIVSHGAALTGSIGVFMLRPELGSMLDKLDVGVERLTRGQHADMLLGSQPLSEASRARLQSAVVDAYDLFVGRVAAGRDMTATEVDSIGQGYVWTGEGALEAGLVDEIGGLREAVYAAKRIQGLERDADVALVPFPAPKPLGEQIAELLQMRSDPLAWLAAGSALLSPGAEKPIVDFARWLGTVPPGVPLAISPVAIQIR